MKQKIKKLILPYGLLLAISIVFLLIYSAATSPISSFFGADSAFFILVGKGMTDGLLPYRDFFDMKGPNLFLIEYIGQLLVKGRLGAFIIQSINLFLSLFIVSKIYINQTDTTISNWQNFLKFTLFIIFPFLFIASYTFERGNLTEEFSLPVLLLSLYFFLSYLKKSENSKQYKHPIIIGFFYGCSFSFFAFIRINNAALLGAILLTIFVILIVKKELLNLFLNGISFLIGIILASLPVLIYCWSNNILQDMLYQVFIFGFQYSSEQSFVQKILNTIVSQWGVILFFTLPIICLLVFKIKNWKLMLFSISSFILLLIAVFMGNGYLHYFTLGIPSIVFACIILVNNFKNINLKEMPSKLLVLFLSIIFILQLPLCAKATASCALKILNLDTNTTHNNSQILEIKEQIPEEDFDNVYVYGISSCSNWYLVSNLYPDNKYCDWQNHYMTISPNIKEELHTWLSNNGSKWLVISKEEKRINSNTKEIINSHYNLFTENDSFFLFKRNET